MRNDVKITFGFLDPFCPKSKHLYFFFFFCVWVDCGVSQHLIFPYAGKILHCPSLMYIRCVNLKTCIIHCMSLVFPGHVRLSAVVTHLWKHLFTNSTLLYSHYFKGLGLRIIPINCLFNSHSWVHSLMILSGNAAVVWVTLHPWGRGSMLGFCLVKVLQRGGGKIWPLTTTQKRSLCFEGFVQKFSNIINCTEINFLSKQDMREMSLEFNCPYWEIGVV